MHYQSIAMFSGVVVVSLVLCAVVTEGSTVLIDPGPVCSGHIVVLTCSVAEGTSMSWRYRDQNIGLFSPIQPPPSDPVTQGGVQFTLSLMQNSTHLLSRLNFTASTDMTGESVECLGGLPSGTFSSDEITLQVELIYTAPAEVRIVDVVNSTNNYNVTIEWTPPTALVQYTTTTTPVSISPTMSVTTTPPTTDPVQMDITLEYNINYTITVTIQTCAGPRQTSTTVFSDKVDCFEPVFSRAVVPLSSDSTFVGGMIMYNCSEGFQPGTVQTSVCADTGQWVPNTTLHTCAADCSFPVFPHNSIELTVSGTTEGAVATFRCEEGLIPSGPTFSTCVACDTEHIIVPGQWLPNPADTECIDAPPSMVDTTVVLTSSTTERTMSQESPDGSAVTLTASLGALLFIVGLLGGLGLGTLIGCCWGKARYKPRPPTPVAPVYEDVVLTATKREEVTLETNVAYGHFNQ